MRNINIRPEDDFSPGWGVRQGIRDQVAHRPLQEGAVQVGHRRGEPLAGSISQTHHPHATHATIRFMLVAFSITPLGVGESVSAPVSDVVLVIEDGRGIVDVLERGLRTHGFTVRAALDGRRGAEMARNEDVDVVVLDLKGKITLGEGDELLKDKVNSLVNQGHKKIVLNLADVPYIDSAGLGEVVRTYTTVSRQGGSLKLLNLTKRITDLLSITKLLTVFETYESENEAVRSFSASAKV